MSSGAYFRNFTVHQRDKNVKAEELWEYSENFNKLHESANTYSIQSVKVTSSKYLLSRQKTTMLTVHLNAIF